MIRNYLKIAWRSLWKRKFFSFINIVSLSIGLSASFIIGMMVYYDFSFDKFHEDGDQIYRVVTDFRTSTDEFSNSGTPVPLGDDMLELFPEVELKVHFYNYGTDKVIEPTTQKVSTINDRIIMTDPSYFDLFEYQWLAGNEKSALDQPNQVVLTEQRAAYFFPDLEPQEIIGQILDYKEFQAEVTGIVADFEENSDLVFTEFMAYSTISQTKMSRMAKAGYDTVSSSSQLFVRLREDADLNSLRTRLSDLAVSKWTDDNKEYGFKTYYNIQPLSDLHFNPEYGIYDYSRSQADKSVLTSLGFVALFLLILGVINFINLNTASATQRAKEIGVRKTLGSSRAQLIKQFLGETFLLTLLAGILSIGLTYWLIHVFSDFIAAGVDLSLLAQPLVLFGVIALIILVTTLSGFYPAMILSGFKPSKVLKGDRLSSSGNTNVRKGLTVFQFAIAQIFIIGTLLVGKQIHFVMNKDMGFSKENRLYLNTPWMEKKFSDKETLKSLISKIPSVESVSLGGAPPASNSIYSDNISMNNGSQEVKTDIQLLYGDTKFLDLYDIPLLAGRKPMNDTLIEFVVNEAAVTAMGFTSPEDVLNKSLTFQDEQVTIVGVMRDFNQRSLKNGIDPMVYLGDTARKQFSQFNTVHIKMNDQADLSETMSKIETAYAQVYPDNEVNIQFTDETVAAFYREDQQLAKLLNWATGLSILISCLGLLGLVVHTTERRNKEIGIRKVLGATVMQINTLLCKDFVILIIIAFIIAAPISYYFLNDYLQDYAYRTDISLWIFAASMLGMLFIALGIMSLRTIATALKNPVESLKTE
ncbi:MAG: FtsX-like permease family protein [Nonlabens sp.]